MLGQTNAKVVSGGNVEVVETSAGVLTNKGDISVLNPTIGIYGKLFINETDFIHYAASNPGGGSNNLYYGRLTISNSVISITSLFTVPLDFGQVYNISSEMTKCAALSPNKDYVAVVGVNGNTNVFLVPLLSSSFGTPVSIDLGVGNLFGVSFISDDTFVACSSSTIYVFKIENGSFSLQKTISSDITISLSTSANGLLMIASSSAVKFIDVVTETTVYSDSGLSITTTNIPIVVDNKVFVKVSNTSIPFKVFIVDNGSVTSPTFSSSLTFTTSQVKLWAKKQSDNNIIIFMICYSNSNNDIQPVCFDFQNLKISTMFVIGNLGTYSYQSSYMWFYNGYLYALVYYQSSTNLSRVFEMSSDMVATKINYDGWQYTVVDKVSS